MSLLLFRQEWNSSWTKGALLVCQNEKYCKTQCDLRLMNSSWIYAEIYSKENITIIIIVFRVDELYVSIKKCYICYYVFNRCKLFHDENVDNQVLPIYCGFKRWIIKQGIKSTVTTVIFHSCGIYRRFLASHEVFV